MSTSVKLTLFHMPSTRSSSTLALLEELKAPYELAVLDRTTGENRQPDYLAINPMGKVPALRHGEALITEQVAIFLYLADLFPDAKMAPPLGDPLRGPYLRWMVYYASCFEPALIDTALKREPGPQQMMPYGDYDSVINLLSEHLERSPFMLGDDLTAADILWGNALAWTMKFGMVPATDLFQDYAKRITERPSSVRATEIDAELTPSPAS